MSPTIYLLAILGLILHLIYNKYNHGVWVGDISDGDDFMEEIGTGPVAGFVIGLITWAIIGNSLLPEPIEVEASKKHLVALKDNQEVSGNFFLGSGSFDGELKYYGYEDIGNDRYKMVKFPISSIIVEDVDSSKESYFVEIKKIYDPNDKVFDYDKWMMGPWSDSIHVRWEIHIPKGSIIRNDYELDLE